MNEWRKAKSAQDQNVNNQRAGHKKKNSLKLGDGRTLLGHKHQHEHPLNDPNHNGKGKLLLPPNDGNGPSVEAKPADKLFVIATAAAPDFDNLEFFINELNQNSANLNLYDSNFSSTLNAKYNPLNLNHLKSNLSSSGVDDVNSKPSDSNHHHNIINPLGNSKSFAALIVSWWPLSHPANSQTETYQPPFLPNIFFFINSAFWAAYGAQKKNRILEVHH